MRQIIATILLFLSVSALAQGFESSRIHFQGGQEGVTLEGFLYKPQANAPKGVVMVIGGSGYTSGGFGGPAKFGMALAQNGFIGFEWNKRGLTSNKELNDVQLNYDLYKTATISNLILDAEAALDLLKTKFPTLPLFVIGGSEGSVVTTSLAQRNPDKIKAISTFGTVIPHFVEIVTSQANHDFLVTNGAFKKCDLDEIDSYTEKELNCFAKTHDDLGFLEGQFQKIDFNSDGRIDRNELLSGISDYLLLEISNPDEYWFEKSKVPPGFFKEMFKIKPLFNRVDEIKVPTLFMHGDLDDRTPIQYAYRLKTQTRTKGYSHIQFKFYKGVGHGPSAQMAADFLKFFESQL
jgi:pimeloyl-ACP methyl ester carboxylesterase